jgi:hypothetical protein
MTKVHGSDLSIWNLADLNGDSDLLLVKTKSALLGVRRDIPKLGVRTIADL